MNQRHISIFRERFVNREDAYYRRWAYGDNYGYRAVYAPVTASLICAHLVGKITLALPAIDVNGLCKWCAWDSDTEDGNLEKIESTLLTLGWHSIREAHRPGRAGHLWLLFDFAVAARDVILFGRQISERTGIPRGTIEFFPKQASAEKLGGALRLPLSAHRKPGAGNCIGWFETVPKDVHSQLEWFSLQPLNPGKRISEIAQMPFKENHSLTRRSYHYQRNTGAISRVTFDLAISRINAKPGSNGWWSGHCPIISAHHNGDRNPSLGIKRAEDGGAIVKCWNDCLPKDIYDRLRRQK